MTRRLLERLFADGYPLTIVAGVLLAAVVILGLSMAAFELVLQIVEWTLGRRTWSS